jgi:hypothetical protein
MTENKTSTSEVDESNSTDKVVAYNRIMELEKLGVEKFSFETYAAMCSVIKLLRAVPNWENLPSPIRQSIEQKCYGIFKKEGGFCLLLYMYIIIFSMLVIFVFCICTGIKVSAT